MSGADAAGSGDPGAGQPPMHRTGLDRPRTAERFRVRHERQPEVRAFSDGGPCLMAPGSKAHTLPKSGAARMPGVAFEVAGCETLVGGAVVEAEGSSSSAR